ncbi:hypothetical protein AcW1_001350 [Taiwanofungus camphoratus]|nr:hypothetical protein AcW2_000119 [Antrodia cinnamomea]KAI0937346.1 hypothetical protein AcV5_005276 [Antrodia cinnamomea]KAI0962558.1 hypothetical protein AcV7_001377 [Antrodia cinnamomea]KAI0964558.1 hypothetical protein AcW1_001350 [Antrodia cinnamomea]
MVKSKEDVIAQFNEQVNMTAEELQKWLDNPESKKAGTGVGVDSGHKIIEILKRNPGKDPEKYEEDDIEHMRKVVAYNGRHMAQEDHLKDTKTKEELEHTKSTISMKNWGHDPMKTLGDGSPASKKEHAKDDETSTKNDDKSSKKKNVDSAANESKTARSGRPKRKLTRKSDDKDDDENDGTEGPVASAEEDTGDDTSSGTSEEGAERPRKKSKTVGASQKAVEKDAEEETSA